MTGADLLFLISINIASDVAKFHFWEEISNRYLYGEFLKVDKIYFLNDFGNFYVGRLFLSQIQVNLFQKYLFMHPLTHNLTKDCPLNLPAQYMKIPSSEHEENMAVYIHCSEWQNKSTKNNLCR